MDQSRRAGLKRSLRRRFAASPTRPIARGALSASIWLALLPHRVLDLASGSTAQRIPAGRVTAVIKTFERPRQVRRLVRSIRRIHPELPIIVVDDSRDPVDLEEFDDLEMLVLPYNTGISAGRNAALERITTPYALFLDDDFVFCRRTHLAEPLAAMDANPTIDIMGGQVANLPDFSVNDYEDAPLFPGAAAPAVPFGSTIGGLRVYPKVANFLLARADRLRLVGWSDELKLLEHRDFFTRAAGVLVTVYNPRWRVLHARNPFDRSSPARVENERAAGLVLWQRYIGRS